MQQSSRQLGVALILTPKAQRLLLLSRSVLLPIGSPTSKGCRREWGCMSGFSQDRGTFPALYKFFGASTLVPHPLPTYRSRELGLC